ncbi:MAG: ABC transporter permease [Flavobacteriales bacterium]|nr:ABC transporter permease [Flavobacteriales bacterium]
MILRFFLFEVRYWLRQPMAYIFIALIAFLTGAAVVSDNVQIGMAVGNVLKNAPYLVYLWYATWSTLGLLLVTAFVNATAIRDFTSNTAQIVFSTPVSKASYLIGKFLGSTFVALLPMLGVSLGIVVGSWWPGIDEVRVGPNLMVHHLQAILLFAIPNVLFCACIIFAVAVLLRSTMAAFITAIALLVGFSIAGAFTSDLENEYIGAMVDPFGGSAFEMATKYWTVEDKNTQVLPAAGVMLWNRLLWIAVSVGVFLFGFWRFSFTDRVQKAKTAEVDGNGQSSYAHVPLPKVAQRFDARARRRWFTSLYWGDVKGILKSTPFILIMSLGLVQLFVSLAFVTELYGNTTYPVTYNVADAIQGGLFIYLIIIVTFYAGQLIWKERDPRIDGITNALPMATGTGLLAKFAALVTVIVVVMCFATLAGMVTQLLNGYTRLQPMVYLTYLIIPTTLGFAFFAAMAMFVHVVVNNKYLGYFVFILLVVLNIFGWSALDVESNLVRLSGSSGLTYSDMNGFGPYLPGWLFFRSYWMVFAAILLFAAWLFLVRGNDTAMHWRWHNAKQRFAIAKLPGIAMVLLFGAMAALGYYNTKVLNEYTTSDEQEQQQVDYEKQYKRFQGMEQPHYTAVEFTIDLEPENRAMRYTAAITLRNKSERPIDTLYLSLPERMHRNPSGLQVEIPGATVVLDDDFMKQRMYRLSPPLAPGADLRLTVKGGYAAKGFENRVSFTGIVQNGSFFNNMDLLPVIGYQADFELKDKNDRKKYELPPNRRTPLLTEDPDQRRHNYLVRHSDWVEVSTTISTAPDQIAIAPGSLVKEWTDNGRRFFRYEVDHPSLNFYSFMSARYEVAREKLGDVDIEVYYHKDHGVNVPRMLNSMKRTIAYAGERFGPYRHKQARIIEFPRYASFAQAFPGTMPYSEAIGFITDLRKPEDIDPVFYVVAHEVGHQWWAHQVIGAVMQGATLLSESMAQYTALMVMEQEYGRPHMRKFMKYEADKYQNARGSEAIGESPLLTVENQGYIHYNKGSVMLYGLREFLGEEVLNQAFAHMVDSFGYAEPPYPTSLDMYRAMRSITPDSLLYLLDDNIKHITLYNNAVQEARASMNTDSSWTVEVLITAAKMHSDSLGMETEAPMNDWMDVAVMPKMRFGKDKEMNDIPLARQRLKLRTGENRITFQVKERPGSVVIDPDHLFFDRLPADNRKKVEVADAGT